MKNEKHSTLIIALIILTVGVAGCQKDPSANQKAAAAGESDKTQTPAIVYTCPMHPSVVSDRPGACPVCGMALVKKAQESGHDHTANHALTRVTISPSRQVLANISTIHAKRKKLHKEISAVGMISYAEPNYKHISTRFPGRLEKLYLNYTGQRVSVGDPVADIYSPDAIAAQKEFLLALESVELTKDAHESIASNAVNLLDQSKQKLLRWGFTSKQISELEESKEVKDIITIYSPIKGTILKKNVDPQHYTPVGEDIYDIVDLSTVWLYAEIYEYEMQWIKAGQTVEAIAEAFPGHPFVGRVSFISPTVDPSSRTVKVRVDMQNPEGLLKLDMFLNTVIKIDLPNAIVVPKSAVISSGKKDVVWIQKEANVFEPREVRLGAESKDGVQILEGITEDEPIVVSGGYLLDSESQLQITTSGTQSHSGNHE
jgi:Cu(I)/Ag(I) efflux system membrane fusion protein